ncbi:MAG: aldehyde dehydrogenase [Proteobacteria bacterium]|nr:MAG: aldehyde dehydrogenase [Pseudomonadota bacterium]
MAIVEWLSDAPAEPRRWQTRSPATLEPLESWEAARPEDVRAAVERARKAQREWAAAGFAERARRLRRALRVLLAREAEFAATIERETGKPAVEILSSELLPAADAIEFYAKRAKRVLADRTLPLHLLKSKKLKLVYKPLGVVGIITPWNFPFILALNPTVQALAAGNGVVLKPSEATPATGRLVEALFREAGLPDGLVACAVGDGATGAALVEAGVDKVSFTGSERTGRKIAEACGRALIPCTLELGGKDPMIVCADADVERAAAGAVYGAFANAGQVCVSTERVYVVDAVADEFVRRVVEHTGRLRQGSGGEADVGPMIWAPQLDVVERHVEDARRRGAHVLTGGRRNPRYEGLYYEPTVLVDVDHDMLVMREESFGPLLPIMRVRDEAEALRLANDSGYGLNASVWSRDKRRGAELARAIESGCAVVNDCLVTYGIAESPFGGVKASGIGRVNGDMGLKGYCHVQSIVVDRFGAKSELLWFPYEARKVRWLRRLLHFVWGTPIGRWLS